MVAGTYYRIISTDSTSNINIQRHKPLDFPTACINHQPSEIFWDARCKSKNLLSCNKRQRQCQSYSQHNSSSAISFFSGGSLCQRCPSPAPKSHVKSSCGTAELCPTLSSPFAVRHIISHLLLPSLPFTGGRYRNWKNQSISDDSSE